MPEQRRAALKNFERYAGARESQLAMGADRHRIIPGISVVTNVMCDGSLCCGVSGGTFVNAPGLG